MAMQTVAAGELDRRVRIEYRSVTKHPTLGSEVVTWTELATVWARVMDLLPGKAERMEGDLRMLTRPCTVRIRYRSTVTAEMRIVLLDRDRILQIVSIAEVGRREAMDLQCEEYSV